MTVQQMGQASFSNRTVRDFDGYLNQDPAHRRQGMLEQGLLPVNFYRF
jgi:hypothetical protein